MPAPLATGALALALWSGTPGSIEESASFSKPRAEKAAFVFEKSVPPSPTSPAIATIVLKAARRVETPPLPAVFATFTVLAQDERPTNAPTETERRRIVRAAFKYPLLRIRTILRDQRIVAEEAVVADQLLVTLQPDATPAALAAALTAERIRVREKMPGSDTLLLQLPGHDLDSVDRARSRLELRGDLFRSVDPNGIGFGALPDPRFGAQWALQNTGQNGGAIGADVNATGLWSIVSSAPKVLVAVLDSGMDFAHDDLANVAWNNPGEIPGNGLDDDGNGFVDDVSGWDFVNAGNNPADDHNHGSHVTGIIAARRENGVGIAGLADPVAILPVKILDTLNTGAASDLIAALDYARLLGASVINLSLQNYPDSGSLQNAIDATEAAGIVICAAAGNQGANNDTTPNYPSSYANANIIAVGNHDRTDARWVGSNYGLASVDLFAPGREIVSTVRNDLYLSMTGTSMACPHVAAVAAILRALNPDWTPADVIGCVRDTVTTRPAYATNCVFGGRLNAEGAINRAIKLMPGGDPDGDGTPSLVEYGLGTDPLRGNAGGVPLFQCNGPMLELTYPHPRNDVSYSVEASDDLINWDAALVNQGGAGSPVTATAPIGISGQRFLRLKVGAQP
ncbi:MAG: S8 family peptidase [Chthoniobacteraceae bacterium]